MIVVRDIFQLKFGKAKEAREAWKEGIKLLHAAGHRGRVLTDVTGQYYTMVLEGEFASLADWENMHKDVAAMNAFGTWYQKFVPMVESGRREIFNIIEF